MDSTTEHSRYQLLQDIIWDLRKYLTPTDIFTEDQLIEAIKPIIEERYTVDDIFDESEWKSWIEDQGYISWESVKENPHDYLDLIDIEDWIHELGYTFPKDED